MGRDGFLCCNRGEPHEAGHAKKIVKLSDDWGTRCLLSLRSARRTYKRSETEVWSAREGGRYSGGFFLWTASKVHNQRQKT